MADLVSFAKHVEEVLRDADRVPHWTPQAAEKYMAEYGSRRQRFEELAKGLNLNVIRPRLETVAGYFANARMKDEEPPHRSSCWLEYSERFPALTHVEFSVEHDARFEKLIVHTKTHMMPVFVRFSEQDNLPLPLDQVDEVQVADWVEERLLEFLDTYLRIDCGSEEFEEEPATDPICGMRIRRSSRLGWRHSPRAWLIRRLSRPFKAAKIHSCFVHCPARRPHRVATPREDEESSGLVPSYNRVLGSSP